ncbi:unnamed protein product [Eruca vesicaria subsp. sativa]|uniref:Uncharacterized protein n=1 Tax=Eruca vesicaria subsp. sativa TaxID=29727 RepID=A0ABC8LEJ2_ERUVS|nr:unnamed protein product [Eruca vesicaria subsp. sativa]
MENIEKNLGFPLPQNGAQVEILDNDKSYWVNLNKKDSSYIIKRGWNKIRDDRGLKAVHGLQKNKNIKKERAARIIKLWENNNINLENLYPYWH